MNRYVFWLVAVLCMLGACANPIQKEHAMDFGENINGSPKVAKGWSSSGTLTTKNVDKIVQLQQEFPEAGPYTISFQRTYPPDRKSAAITEALIEWSVQGNTITRRVSVMPGMSISGNANAVRVTVIDKSTVGPAGDYQVIITVAPGTRPPTQTQPFLYADNNFITLAPNASDDFDVPLDAGVSSVMVLVATENVAPAAAPPIPEQAAKVQHRGDSLPSGVPWLTSYDPRAYAWVPLMPGAKLVRVKNENAAGQASQTFTVLWGIDG